jgi:anaphase-promoting complex subunit 1
MFYQAGTGFDNQIKRTAVREAQNIIGVCIGAVLAGSGEIMVMRALRYNHGCWGPGWRYGTHMATHLSIGLLFLGGGRYTLGNSNAAVACLLASLFPRFPPHLGETRGLLQAFRHLWALAIEPRCMLTRDADTGETVYLPVKVKRADESGLRTMEMYSPTLLPDFDPIVSISIDTPRYWPITIDLSNPRHRETFLRTQTIYVKRRPGSSQYKEDPKGSRSMLVRHLVGDPSILDLPEKCQGKPTATDEFYLLLDSKLTDPSLIAFADRFCRNYAHDDASPREQILFAFCQQTLLECLTYDKPQTIHAHLSLFQAQFAPSPITVRDLLFAESFYKLFVAYGGVVDSTPRHPLIRLSALRSALYTMEERMQTLRRSPRFMSALRQYVRGEAVAPEEGVAERKRLLSDLALYLTRESVPSLQVLQDIRTMALETFSVPSDDPHTVHTAVMLISRTPVVGKQAIGAPSWTFQSVDEILTLWK